FGVPGRYGRLSGTLDLATAAAGRWRVSATAEGGTEVRNGIGAGGADAGALYAAYGVIAALRQRARTGEGVYLDVSQIDCQIMLNAHWLIAAVESERINDQGQGDPEIGPVRHAAK